MRTVYYCSFVFVCLSFVSSAVFSENVKGLCETCDCSPNTFQASRMNCDCKNNKILLFKDEDSETLSQTQSLHISGCNFISFPQKGFPKSKKLKTLEIKATPLFHFITGIFPNLNTLIIENVSELIIDSFRENSLLSHIEIKNSSIAELSQDIFKDVKSLSKLSFTDTSIRTIASHSIHLASTTIKPAVQFINCKIDEIQSASIDAHVSRFEILNSSLNIIEENGITVNAAETINLTRNKFSALLQLSSLKLRSRQININENEFASLPSNILVDMAVQDKKINFVGNSIYDIDLGGFLLNSNWDKVNFTKNQIMCDCTPRKTSILRLKEVFPGLLLNESYFDRIIEHNFCYNYGGIRLSEFKNQLLRDSVCNNQSDPNFMQMDSPTDKDEGEKFLTVGNGKVDEKNGCSNVIFEKRNLLQCVIILIAYSFYYQARV